MNAGLTPSAIGLADNIGATGNSCRGTCLKLEPEKVCVNLKTGPHSTAALMQARPRGARLHDYWQQASKRGAAKEVRFPGFRLCV
jgi:hypothetical protein